jgi:chemotaxis protein MotB
MADMTTKHDHYIVVKRVKKSVAGHHGGNWKVAYADFMTALMAFFLLLWILSGSNEEQLRGLAEYFTPSEVPLVEISGIGTLIEARKVPSSDPDQEDMSLPKGPDAEGPEESDTQEVRNGALNPWLDINKETTDETTELGNALPSFAEAMRTVEEDLSRAFEQTPELAKLSDHLMMSREDDGLVIEIVDLGDRPMFESASATVGEDFETILKEISTALTSVNVNIAITGHTDAHPFVNNQNGYSNWELSADRANATRRALIAAGVPENVFTEVSGVAAVHPLIPEDPENARNRRVSLVLLDPEA